MKFLPLLLLMFACTTYPYPDLTYDELFHQASSCSSAKAIGCDPLWDEINRRDDVTERREAKIEAETCQRGLVGFVDHWGNFNCITRWQLQEIFRQMNGRLL